MTDDQSLPEDFIPTAAARQINPDFVMIDLAESLMRLFNEVAAAPPELTNTQPMAMAMAFAGSAWQQYQDYLAQLGDPQPS